MNETLLNIRKNLNEYKKLNDQIKAIKDVKDYYKIKEKLYEKLDNAYYEEERLKYSVHTPKQIKMVKNTQKVMSKRIKKLNKYYMKKKKND